MIKIVLATGNLGKVKEIEAYLRSLPITVVPQSDYAVPPVEENGLSYIENALIKARHTAKYSGLPALADDSGLSVDALGGEPGIHSARYAGQQATSEDNIQKLLTQTAPLSLSQRQARFICVLAFVRHEKDPLPLICQAQWEGHLLTEKQGQEGFGYDPIFFIPELNCTAAELPLSEKNKLSHRAKALNLFVQQIQPLLPALSTRD